MNWERLDKELISFKVVWIHYKKDGPNEVNSIITFVLLQRCKCLSVLKHFSNKNLFCICPLH
jgi:hypothetical protein